MSPGFIPPSWFAPPHPRKACKPLKPGAKPTRHDPAPNHAPSGKRRRQWR